MNFDERVFEQAERQESGVRIKIVNQYLVESSLGYGVLGEVKLARHYITFKPFALRIIEKNKFREDLKITQNDVNALKLLQHPNIIQCFDTFDSD